MKIPVTATLCKAAPAMALALTMAAPTTSALAATSGSHYPIGGEGVLAGTMPPPGFHYRIYNTYTNPTRYKDNSGNTVDNDFDLEVFSTVHRFVHVTEKKLFGANYAYNVIIPFAYKDFSMDTPAGHISDSQSLALGDITVEPFALRWEGKQWDMALGLAAILPTGDYSASEPASPGLGYWSGMLSFGGSYYFDEQKSWSFSALTRTLVNSEQDDTDITPGSEFAVEYGVGKQFPLSKTLLIRPGIAGASSWQFTDDSGGDSDDLHKQSHALGAEVNVFSLSHLFQVDLRYLQEFGARNTSQGSQIVLTLTKSW